MSNNSQPEASHFVDGAHVEDKTGTAFNSLHPATCEVIATVHNATGAIL